MRGYVALCAYVKLSTLNSATDPELRDRKVEDRANLSNQRIRTKFIFKKIGTRKTIHQDV